MTKAAATTLRKPWYKVLYIQVLLAIVLGALLIVILAFFPEGLAGLARPFARMRPVRAATPSTPVTTLESLK